MQRSGVLPAVCRRSTVAVACGWFAAELGRAGSRDRSMSAARARAAGSVMLTAEVYEAQHGTRFVLS